MIIDDNNVVGAGLVPAHDIVLSDDGSIVGASDHDVVTGQYEGNHKGCPYIGSCDRHIQIPCSQSTNQLSNSLISPGVLPVTHHSLHITAFQPNEPNELITVHSSPFVARDRKPSIDQCPSA